MNARLSILVLGLLAVISAVHASPRSDFYVAPNGNDKSPGTKAKPFATLEAARNAIREAKKSSTLPQGGITVWIRGGVYNLSDSFNLTSEDSGTEKAPIIYRACEGEDVLITGGKEVKGWKRVTNTSILKRLDPSARGKVVQADLKAQGITNYGEMTRRGFGIGGAKAGLELFCNDQPMTIARWPNDGWAKIAGIPNGQKGGKFTYDGDRPKRWIDTDDIWVHGYWTWDWAESYEKIKSLNTETREIETMPPHGVYGYTKDKRFYFLNVLEELDQFGEWYLDRKTGILYFYPIPAVPSISNTNGRWKGYDMPYGGGLPSIERMLLVQQTKNHQSEIRNRTFVSILDKPLINMQDVSRVTFKGIVFEHTRGEAVWMIGGSNDLIEGCIFRNIGTTAITMTGGKNNGVLSCNFSETGNSGIYIDCGDRKTLTSGNCFVTNCIFVAFSRWVKTYQPAVSINGVGNKVDHCLIHDAPHSAIILSGNEHKIEFNDISRVCLETGDAGAFYMGRNWTQRGNVIRYNYFHDLQPPKGVEGWVEVMGVYFDDWTSGNRCYGNLFVRAGRAFLLGGGRDNVCENNVFVDCKPAIHFDARGVGGMKDYFDDPNNTLYKTYKDIGGDKPPYSTRYPELLTMFKGNPGVPEGNHINRNIFVSTMWLDLHTPNKYDTKVLDISNNLINSEKMMLGDDIVGLANPPYADVLIKPNTFIKGDPGFIDAAHGNYQLKPDSPAWKLGFKRIPIERIGLYVVDP